MNEAAGAASIGRNSDANSADAKNSKAKVHLEPGATTPTQKNFGLAENGFLPVILRLVVSIAIPSLYYRGYSIQT
jgi:hypothetical protein